MSTARPPTQIFQRKQLASAATAPFIGEAEQLMEKGDFAAARAKLEQGLSSGRTVEALLGLAEAYWDDPDTRARDPKRSIDFLKEAIQLAPKDARPYALLGRYLLSKGLRDQALNFLDRAIQLDPADGASRRLRERASLQKKKAYTVVANAKDLGLDRGPPSGPVPAVPAVPGAPAVPPPPVKAAQQAKREATRFLQIDPKRAVEEMAKAEAAVANELDAALAALLGANLVQADVSILKGDGALRRGGNIVRTLIAFVVVIVTGLAFGALLQRYAPSPGVGSQGGVPGLVMQDTPSSLLRAIQLANEKDDPATATWAALAHAALMVEHGADEGHLESAEDTLSSLQGPARRAPPALLARALVATRPLAERDDELEADLEAAAEDARAKADPLLLMARAQRALDEGEDGDALELLSRAALDDDAPPRALHRLARRFAAAGDTELALTILKRLVARHPKYTPGMATAVAVEALEASRTAARAAIDEERERKKKEREKRKKKKRGDDDDDDERDEPAEAAPADTPKDLQLSSLPAVKRALDVLYAEPPVLESADAAPLALVIAAVASAAGDDALHGRMMQRAQEGDVEQRFPGLASKLAQLILLDLGDFTKAETMLSDGLSTYPGEVALLVDRTRARAGRGLKGERVRVLRTNAERRLENGAIVLPLGRFLFDFDEGYLPLRPVFDSQVFPEDAIRNALDIKGITAQAAERRLSVVANLKLAQLALAQGDVDEAADRVERARKEAGTNPEVFLTAALVHAKKGNAVRAREAIDEALGIAPDDPRILVAAARLQIDAGDLDAARRSLARVAAEGFVSPAAMALGARIALKERRTDDARKLLATARKLAPTDVAVLRAGLDVEHQAGAFDDALLVAGAMRTALGGASARADDGDFVGRSYLGWAAAAAGDVDEGLEEIDDVLSVRQGFAEGHYIRGRVLEEKREREQARAAYEEAAKLGGAAPVATAANDAILRLDGKTPPAAVDEQEEPSGGEPRKRPTKGAKGKKGGNGRRTR